jgi:DNA-binding response OmpR family regulator
MKRTILLVDDDTAVLESLTRVLVDEDYHVLPACNGQEALDLVACNAVDLVLLDLNMPVKNGWDTFERLSNDHQLVPIIIVTARPNQLFLARAAGVGALIEKPLDIPILLQTILDLLSEPAERRLARLAGKRVELHYAPAAEPPKHSKKIEGALAIPRWGGIRSGRSTDDKHIFY